MKPTQPLPELLNELEKLESAATPGPWGFDGKEIDQHRAHEETGVVDWYGDTPSVIAAEDTPVCNFKDGLLIAQSRNALPQLIQALREALGTMECYCTGNELPGFEGCRVCLFNEKWGCE